VIETPGLSLDESKSLIAAADFQYIKQIPEKKLKATVALINKMVKEHAG